MQIAGVLSANAKDLVNPDWITGGKTKSLVGRDRVVRLLQLQLVLVRRPRLLAASRQDTGDLSNEVVIVVLQETSQSLMVGGQLAVNELREPRQQDRVKCYADEKLSKPAISFTTIFIHRRHLVLKISLRLFV